MAGIKLVQGSTTYNASGDPHPAPITLEAGVLCYLSFTGTTTAYMWSLSRPAGSHAVISNSTSASPTFVPDIDGGSYSITLIDASANVYVLDVVTATPGIVITAGGVNVIVATIASFRAHAAASTTPATAYIVQSYNVLGDGGRGELDYDATDTTTADDGGAVFVVSPWRFKRREARTTNVFAAWWGLPTDGTTNSASQLTSAMAFASSIGQSFTTILFQQAPVRIQLPAGRTLALATTVEVPTGIHLMGNGCVLTPTPGAGDTISLLRFGVANSIIERVSLKGGFNQIALMGVDFDTTAGIHRPGAIIDCEFANPKGHAIWQDMTSISRPGNYRSFQCPLRIVRPQFIGAHFFWGVGDKISIENGILTSDMCNAPTTTSVICDFNAGTDTFTANTPATHPFQNGDRVATGNEGGLSGSGLVSGTIYFIINRTSTTFQVSLTSGGSPVNITATSFCHVDKIKFQVSSDGLPLPIIAWGANLVVSDTYFEFLSPGAGMPLPPARRAHFCGQGNLIVRGSVSFDGGGCGVRFRGTGNSYQGIGEAAVTLDCGAGAFPSTVTWGESYINSAGFNVGEIYYEMPSLLVFGRNQYLNSDACLGWAVNSDTVDLTLVPVSDGDDTHRRFFQRHKGDPAPGNQGQVYSLEVPSFRRFRLVNEANMLTEASLTGATDISDRMTAYMAIDPDEVEANGLARTNLFFATADCANGVNYTLGGSGYTTSGTVTADNGYTLTQYVTTGAGASFLAKSDDYTSGSGLPASVFTYGIEVLSEASGSAVMLVYLNNRKCNLRRVFFEANKRKRVWVPFYAPALGASETLAVGINIFEIPNGVHFSLGLSQLVQGYGPAPYESTFFPNAIVLPSVNPSSGFIAYASGGAPYRRHSDGTVT